MHRIASKTELQGELHAILGYARTLHPSRQRIARQLQDLSLRLALSREPTERARTRMYDAWARAKGDSDQKFRKMLDALYKRVNATKDAAKLEGILTMLQEETSNRQRWNPDEIHRLKQVLDELQHHLRPY